MHTFKDFLLEEMEVPERHQLLLGAVAPRPIAFVSTMDKKGNVNLAPYSFFNAFSSNPPIVIFSSNRRVKGNTTKDTLHNVEQTGECVINIVSEDIVRQMSLASIEYPAEINEFEKAGFTTIDSNHVKPPRVAESPFNLECKVKKIIALGDGGGAGNLVICEVIMIHAASHVFDENGKIVPARSNQVARMGRSWYSRVNADSAFVLHQPVNQLAMGFNALPDWIKTSAFLSGNELAELASLSEIPDSASSVREKQGVDPEQIKAISEELKSLLADGRKEEAWKLLAGLPE